MSYDNRIKKIRKILKTKTDDDIELLYAILKEEKVRRRRLLQRIDEVVKKQGCNI